MYDIDVVNDLDVSALSILQEYVHTEKDLMEIVEFCLESLKIDNLVKLRNILINKVNEIFNNDYPKMDVS
jgi:hypothetical protein